MNRREFLDLLRYYLRSYPANIINDIVADYEEHFRIGMEHGKSEAEISAELGSPKDIADEFLSHEVPPRPNFNPNFGQNPQRPGGSASRVSASTSPRQTSPWLVLLLILGAVVVFPPTLGVILGLFGSFIGIMAALLVTVLALGISGVASLLSWIHPIGQYVTFFGNSLHPVTAVFLGIFLICMSILIGYLSVWVLTVCLKGAKNLYLSIRWSIAKRRGK